MTTKHSATAAPPAFAPAMSTQALLDQVRTILWGHTAHAVADVAVNILLSAVVTTTDNRNEALDLFDKTMAVMRKSLDEEYPAYHRDIHGD